MPGTGWPEPGGFLPREALKLLGLVAAEGICGLEVVEVSPPYDTSDITALLGVRVVVEALGSMVAHGKLGAHKAHHRQAGQLLRSQHASRTRHDHHHQRRRRELMRRSAFGAGHNRARRRGPRNGRRRISTGGAGRRRATTRSASRISIWSKRPSSKASLTATDPTSFLRLANVPFEATAA